MNNLSALTRIAAIQMVSSPSVDTNLQVAKTLITEAADAGAQLVVLPEYFCIMGRHDGDKVALREPFGKGPLQDFLSDTARQHTLWLAGGTIPLESPDTDRIYNSSLVYGPDGKLQARYDKIHLFGFNTGREAYDEARSIRPGDNAPQVFEAPWGRTGLSVCYDLRFPELYRAMGDTALLLVPSAFTHTTGKAHWEILLRARAIENQCYVLAAAQGGRHENGRRTWGHSMIVDPWGEIVAVHEEGPAVVIADLDSTKMANVRQQLPALSHRSLLSK